MKCNFKSTWQGKILALFLSVLGHSSQFNFGPHVHKEHDIASSKILFEMHHYNTISVSLSFQGLQNWMRAGNILMTGLCGGEYVYRTSPSPPPDAECACLGNSWDMDCNLVSRASPIIRASLTNRAPEHNWRTPFHDLNRFSVIGYISADFR